MPVPIYDKTNVAVSSFTKLLINESPLRKPIPTKKIIESLD